MGSVWKVKNKDWAIFLASVVRKEGQWDSLKFKCLEVAWGSFSITVNF